MQQRAIILIATFLLLFVIFKSQASYQRSRNHNRNIFWRKTDLNYSLFGHVASQNQTSLSSIKKAVRDAFTEWETNSCFRFTEITPSSTADIKLVFTNDHLMSGSKQPQSSPFEADFAHKYFCKSRITGILIFTAT